MGGLAVLGIASPARGLTPPEHELQRLGLERADGASVRAHRSVSWSPPRAARTAWSRFLAAYPDAAWRAQWDADLAIPTRVYGRGLLIPGASADPTRARAAARALLVGHLDLFAPGAEPDDFVLVTDHVERGLRTIGFAQRHHGRPVRGGHLSVRIRADRLFVIGADAYPRVAVPAAPLLPTDPLAAAAKAWLRKVLGAPELVHRAGPGPAFVLPLVGPDGTTDYALVREVTFDVPRPAARWTVFVDAQTGTPVAREQSLRFFEATLELDVPDRFPQNGRQRVPARSLGLTVGTEATRTDDRGRFRWAGPETVEVVAGVTGENAYVVDDAGGSLATRLTAGPLATLVAGAPEVPEDDAQLAAYHAADRITRYVEQIAPENPFVRSAQVLARVNVDDDCNAFSDGESIHFFRGSARCENTARLLDVVAHEYGHTVHAQSILEGVGRFDGAMSEGSSDYLAATLSDDPGMGRGFFRDGRALRHLDLPDDERWPEDIQSDPHGTGIIYGGALWDLRKALIGAVGREAGIARADRLWYEALRRAVDIPSTYVEILAADDDDGDLANGTPSFCAIQAAFARHGLADPDLGGVALGPVEHDGLVVRLPVRRAETVCPGRALAGAEIEWRVRGRPEIGGRVPLEGAPEHLSATLPADSVEGVLGYRILVRLESGDTITFPRNPADPFYETYVGEVVPIACTDFETSPWDQGWTHALLEGTDREGADDWQWGQPQGEPGSGDPEAAHSGTHVVGNDLGGGRFNGSYQPNKSNALVSPRFDVAGFDEVRLQYRRWLNVEDGSFDQAQILADGEVVWANSSEGSSGDTHHEDREWRFHDVDLTPLAADGTIQLEFRITSDGGLELGGWTIDDLCLVGVGAPAPVCGDGRIGAGEACDDGNLAEGDGCEPDCTPTPPGVCGDGTLAPEGGCDDGNLAGGDGCEPDCTPTPADAGICPDGGKPPCDPPEPTPGPASGDLGPREGGCGCQAGPTASRATGRDGLLLALGLGLLVSGRRRRR